MPKKKQDANGELPIERVPIQARQVMRAAKSLRPGPVMMNACLSGDPEAQAVRDSWRFSHPVRVVSPEEFKRISEQGETVFNG